MDSCIFCKIVKKEIPAHIVYENEDFLAFLDIRPVSAGHTLVIPKQHYRWVWDVSNVGEYFETTRTIVKAQQKAFSQEKVICRIIGEEIPHAHIWLIPNPDEPGNKDDFEGNRKKIIAALE